MLKIYQLTISEPVSLEGIGLHTGKNAELRILPGNDDQGIIFKRSDLTDNNIIEANYNNVSNAKLCTTLKNKSGIKVSTVEHLLAALYISEIDNAVIEINNEEVPIMDGSAKDFLSLIQKAGIKKLSKKKKYLKILKKVDFTDGDRKISIEPNGSSFEVDFQLKYENKIIGNQKNVVNFQSDKLNDISNSRTFCLYEDVEKIKKFGLAQGGSLENALVVDRERVLNQDGLRNEKEFVNHKILDLAGDFLLSGYSVLGKVTCYQGGHELTNLFLRNLLGSKSAVQIIELNDIRISKKINSYHSIKSAVSA